MIKRARKACVRRDRRSGDWIVLRAVRFIYDGQGFIMRITSQKSFRVTISGVGQLKLNGRGAYVLNGVAHRLQRQTGDPAAAALTGGALHRGHGGVAPASRMRSCPIAS